MGESTVQSRPRPSRARAVSAAGLDPRTMEPLDDATVRRCTFALRRGDAGALARLYEARFDWMIAMLMHATRRDEAFALDCAQDAWIRAARAPVECASAAALDAWLRRVALSAALDRLRNDAARRAREAVVAARGAGRSALVVELERSLESIDGVRAALSTALDRCGDDDRGLLLMRFRAGMTLAQMAASCGLGAAAVDSRIRRTLASLRGAMANEEAAP